MSNAVKVVYFSTIENQEDLKWNEEKRRPLLGEELANKLEELIADQLHQGYRFVHITDVHSRTTMKKYDMSHHHTKPTGMLVIFEKM
ncbi:MAG: hypothetical protein AAFP77_09145 [Bacteroidota bacterium]